MNIVEYFAQFKVLIASSSIIFSWEYQEDIRTSNEGFFKARLHFIDDSILDFREYVNIEHDRVERYTYSFHYHNLGLMIFRYDNTPHHPQLSSFPHHKHLNTGEVIGCETPDLLAVLTEIENIIFEQ
ncbi:hypothetical protein JW964_02850 [candidate division KSB1 bacterium]|nr:hypothetical protein [candidate division KSB1 bacterium]